MYSHSSHRYFLVLLALFVLPCGVMAQQSAQPLSLQQAVHSALENNHLLKARRLQVEENQAKVKESRIKHFPSVIINSNWRYQRNIGSLDIPQGSLGSLPMSPTNIIPLPGRDLSFELGEHRNFDIGVTLYQPITQQAKIHSGVQLSKTEEMLSKQQRTKAAQDLTLGVQKVYYKLLINQKEQEEARARLEAARLKLQEAEDALEAGKTVAAKPAGLQANASNQQQELLKLQIEAEDYRGEFEKLTGLSADRYELQEVNRALEETAPLEQYKSSATEHNVDLNIAALKQKKARIATQAARRSYWPDLGLVAGYTYQEGNDIYPKYNPFVGAKFKWNLQEIFSNRQVVQQRELKTQQARENLAEQRQQVTNDIEKTYRKLRQINTLVSVALQTVEYRQQELNIKADQDTAGLGTRTDLLEARADLAKAQADLYSARLQYQLALAKLKMLTEGRAFRGKQE